MNLIPVLRYKDCAAAIDWLVDAFGFERKSVHEGRVDGSTTRSLPTATAWSCSARTGDPTTASPRARA